ncbi:MAG: outer membrane beta-barrel protein [Bacteroidales bacterium]|nr:outer membrane beta-barrel protein [Bacteroidales bacterium]
MSDSFYSDVKKKVERIPNAVPEGSFEVIIKRVRRRRLWRRTATYASGAAAAAILAFLLIGTKTENGGITPETYINTYDDVAENTPILIEATDTGTSEKVSVKESFGFFASITTDVPEKETDNYGTTPEKESPNVEKPIEKTTEYYAQVQSFEPEHMSEQQSKSRIEFSISGTPFSQTDSNPALIAQSTFMRFCQTNQPNFNPFYFGPDHDKANVLYKHRFPVSIKFSVSLGITDRTAIESGLTYSYLRSSARPDFESVDYEYDQRLHFLGIPLGIKYDIISRNSFSIYSRAGIAVEKCINGVITDGTYTDRLVLNPLFWSAEASLGAQVKVFGKLNLFLESGGSYHFDNGIGDITIYGANPLLFTLQAGARIGL